MIVAEPARAEGASASSTAARVVECMLSGWFVSGRLVVMKRYQGVLCLDASRCLNLSAKE